MKHLALILVFVPHWNLYVTTGFNPLSNLSPKRFLRIDRHDIKSPTLCNVSPSSSVFQELEESKAQLIRSCASLGVDRKAQIETVRYNVRNLEDLSQELGIGKLSSEPGLLSGEWELLFSSDDTTRSSPFFWAFRKAFPDKADPIFYITDSIPDPLKKIGPAFQSIDVPSKTWVSKVTVSSLGSETTIMTTRCTILSTEGTDGLRLRVQDTKPQDSTILKLLGPLGTFINDSLPPFPSGDALDRVRQGSSEVVVRTTFCDEGLRISRNDDRLDDFFVWVRVGFRPGSEL